MHYYQFHIGDYRAATAHLSNEEDLAYRRLLDMFYDTEQPIPGATEWVARRIRVDEAVVVNVLADMFEPQQDGTWTHKRVMKEIERYHALEQRNRLNGSKGGRPKKPTGLPLESQTEPTQKATNNHKPITKHIVFKPEGVSEAVWTAFVEHRKSKKAQVSELVINNIAQQASEAGWTLEAALTEMVSRGWQGFKAGWVKDKALPAKQETPEERRKRLAFM